MNEPQSPSLSCSSPGEWQFLKIARMSLGLPIVRPDRAIIGFLAPDNRKSQKNMFGGTRPRFEKEFEDLVRISPFDDFRPFFCLYYS
ncbi:hypothetical protein TNCV_4247211 [Trichonephila clavipes]|nr:hypothetical protein TNCV_4247211 [Trichonephila clavipes]